MAKVFDDILVKGVRGGKLPARTQEARDWFRATAKSTSKINETSLMKGDKDRLTSRMAVGRMYHFFYDPKHKATLPYYDKFPLVFPFSRVKGGFLGLNVHYLPLKHRAILMDALYDVVSDQRYDEKTKLKLNYGVLKSASKFKGIKPCIKHYLTPHLRSRFLTIYPSEWDIALFLPTARFEKSSKTKVWADSLAMIK